MRILQKTALLSLQCIAFSILAAATVNNCNTGTILCCSTVEPATSANIALLRELLGDPTLSDLQGLIGIGCNPISPIGVTLGSCTTPPVCCTLYFPGLIASGCDYISL